MPSGLTISVTRSGGFAGLSRKWVVTSTLDEAGDLLELVEACPWHDVLPAVDSSARDRFRYVITARAPRMRRAATVPEAALVGPWKVLVQRVQLPHVPPETS